MPIASHIFFKKTTFRKTNEFTSTTEVIGLKHGCRSPGTKNYNLSYIENNKEAEIVRQLKILKLLPKIEKKIR